MSSWSKKRGPRKPSFKKAVIVPWELFAELNSRPRDNKTENKTVNRLLDRNNMLPVDYRMKLFDHEIANRKKHREIRGKMEEEEGEKFPDTKQKFEYIHGGLDDWLVKPSKLEESITSGKYFSDNDTSSISSDDEIVFKTLNPKENPRKSRLDQFIQKSPISRRRSQTPDKSVWFSRLRQSKKSNQIGKGRERQLDWINY